MTLEIDAVDGRIFPTPVTRTASIGSITNSSTLNFDPPKVSVDCNITFTFVPEMALERGDIISLRLPHFSRSAGVETYNCSNFVKDAYGVEHCLTKHSCISEVCSLALIASSEPPGALQVVRWLARDSECIESLFVASKNRKSQMLRMNF